MAKKIPRVGRPPASAVAPGIFQRGKTYWLRYSASGEQIRVSLETEDPTEAIKRADERRGRKITGKKTGRVVGGKTPIDRALDKYKAARLGVVGGFGGRAEDTARLAVTHFSKSMGVQHPEEITSENLATYYAKTREEKSEATAQTYVARVGTFARWNGLRVTSPKFSEETPSREVVIAKGKVNELLETSKSNVELKFILLCGFRAGMRRAEISMARPAWFDLENGKIRIPAKDPVSGFVPKSQRSRIIPLVPEFVTFIRENFPDWKNQKWCLRPEKEMGKWRYRFDFRKMFDQFAKKNCPTMTAHVMRHSYASHLANYGVGIAQLASWVGDRIATLERHYLHLQADASKAEAAFETPGQREAQEKAAKAAKKKKKADAEEIKKIEAVGMDMMEWFKASGFSGTKLLEVQRAEGE